MSQQEPNGSGRNTGLVNIFVVFLNEPGKLPPARRYRETFKEARMTKLLVWLVATGIGLAPAIAQARSASTSGERNISTQSGAATQKSFLESANRRR
jgi:hypothetical protein